MDNRIGAGPQQSYGGQIVGAAGMLGGSVIKTAMADCAQQARQLEIPYRMRSLAEAADELEKLAVVLNDRLVPVLAPQPVDGEAKCGHAGGAGTDLGGKIEAAEDRVRGVAGQLRFMLGALEL